MCSLVQFPSHSDTISPPSPALWHTGTTHQSASVPSVRKLLKQGRISRSVRSVISGRSSTQLTSGVQNNRRQVTFTPTPSKRLSNPVWSVFLVQRSSRTSSGREVHARVLIFFCRNAKFSLREPWHVKEIKGKKNVPAQHAYTERKAAEGHDGARRKPKTWQRTACRTRWHRSLRIRRAGSWVYWQYGVRESPAEDEGDEAGDAKAEHRAQTFHPAAHNGGHSARTNPFSAQLSHIDLYPLSSPVNTTVLPHEGSCPMPPVVTQSVYVTEFSTSLGSLG